MGYSYTQLAGLALEAITEQLKAASPREIKCSNMWIHKDYEHFHEIGREQADGSITGSVHRCYAKGLCERAINIGPFRIEPNGEISRFPTSKKHQRQAATDAARAKFAEIHGQKELENQLALMAV